MDFDKKFLNTRQNESYQANVDDPTLVDKRVVVTNSTTNPIPVSVVSGGVGSSFLDGGSAATVFTLDQQLDGGSANTF